jgi:hypothetical protein
VTADALRKDARAGAIQHLDNKAVSMGARGGKLGSGHGEHAHRLARNGVCGLGTAPRLNHATLDRGAHERTAEAALLGVAHRELGIGGEQEQRLLVRGQIMMYVRHAHLFIAADERTEGVARRDAGAQQVGARIQREHGRPLVVDHTAAEQPSFAPLHGEGVGRPTGACGDHVDMRDGGDMPGALASDIGKTDITLVISHLIAQALCNGEGGIQRPANGRAKGGTCLAHRRIGNRGMRHEGGDICDDVLPHLVDVVLDVLHHISAHGRPLPSQLHQQGTIMPQYNKRLPAVRTSGEAPTR